ncbi:MAG: homoserine O-acetyltransferase [Bacteroidales bacterium]|nr:homoserine O-acetyltransferase [Bacteroidales bacterium]
MNIYHHNKPFDLELGGSLPELTIAYHTYGTLSPERDNVVWVCHALTANSDVADWWPHTVEKGRFLDPEKYFIICANILGSCYGTTGPLHKNPLTGKGYYRSFPRYTMRDIVRVHQILADALGIEKIKILVGSSVGGFQAIEWAVEQPERFGKLILIATDAKASPWTIAIDETQRMAILADPTYVLDIPEGGSEGLATARALALLTYRGAKGYNLTQQDPDDLYTDPIHRACTYQRYQGQKLVRRFDAYSYLAILQSFDTHNVGRGRGGIPAALSKITMPTMVVGITTDIVFIPEEMRELADLIPNAQYFEIDSPFGHDGFLVEADLLNTLLIPFMTDDEP